MTDNPQYWYARSGDGFLSRNNYTPVHWKGFVALFGTIFGCIVLLIGGVLSTIFVLSGEVVIENTILKWGAVIVGAAVAICAFGLAIYAFVTLRKRVDPVNNAAFYRKKFFQKLSGK